MIVIDREYKTVGRESSAETVEKKSRFIANVKPVSSEEEALKYLSYMRQKYWDARHNVYAYIIRENNIMRYSDDGEPSGTAGIPVLDILKKEGLTDIIVVVTRYFGGILLGTGGLVHAYSKAAKDGIAAARVKKMSLCRRVQITCDYGTIGKIQYETEKFDGAAYGDINYGEAVEIDVFVTDDKADMYISSITDKTNGSVKIEKGEADYFEI